LTEVLAHQRRKTQIQSLQIEIEKIEEIDRWKRSVCDDALSLYPRSHPIFINHSVDGALAGHGVGRFGQEKEVNSDRKSK
jgi:hypothetical protein